MCGRVIDSHCGKVSIVGSFHFLVWFRCLLVSNCRMASYSSMVSFCRVVSCCRAVFILVSLSSKLLLAFLPLSSVFLGAIVK